MTTTQPCRVYLHPTAASNPATIRAIIQRTGLAIVVGGNPKGATLACSTTPAPQEPGNACGSSAAESYPWDGGFCA